MAILLPASILFCFRNSVTDPGAVLFSNDGPLAVLNSDYMVDAAPGVGCWNDLWWLGQNNGVIPISPSYLIMWSLRGHNWIFTLACIVFVWSLSVGIRNLRQK